MSSSRNTLDTNSLRVRDIYAFNPSNNDFIQPVSIPVIGTNGHLTWLSTVEFLSTISVPTESTSVLNLLTAVKPGLSSLSTAITTTLALGLVSTVKGLGTAGYVSTQTLFRNLTYLATDYGYISSTVLFDSFVSLADMAKIHSMGPMGMFNPALSNGYVSTIHPGEYRIYKSSIGITGANAFNTPLLIVPNTATPTVNIDIGGYSNHIVNSSKMKIDIAANLSATYDANPSYPLTTLSSFLVSGSLPIGSPVRITYTNSNVTQATLSFLLNSNDLTPFPTGPLQLQHRMTNVGSVTIPIASLTSWIPDTNGVFVTLDNTD
jgi:hypothetical protein